MENKGKLIIFSAPSGSGKSTIVQHLLKKFPSLKFSISATSRPPRGEEKDGIHYHFLSPDSFKDLIEKDAFLEWEEVYKDTYYGTLKSEIDKLWRQGFQVVFDIDVEGGINLKNIFKEDALAIFVQAPNMQTLESRLKKRGTDSAEKIAERLEKAGKEIQRAVFFDEILINDNLEEALVKAESLISSFISQ